MFFSFVNDVSSVFQVVSTVEEETDTDREKERAADRQRTELHHRRPSNSWEPWNTHTHTLTTIKTHSRERET